MYFEVYFKIKEIDKVKKSGLKCLFCMKLYIQNAKFSILLYSYYLEIPNTTSQKSQFQIQPLFRCSGTNKHKKNCLYIFIPYSSIIRPNRIKFSELLFFFGVRFIWNAPWSSVNVLSLRNLTI